MFTGIIEAVGRVTDVASPPSGRCITIDAPGFWDTLAPGASVAVDGVCLTLTRRDGSRAAFDVIAETLRRSTLSELAPGGEVNLERAMTLSSRLDGHFVQGHVDAVATVSRVESSAAEALWFFQVEPAAMKYIVPKGGVAVDGISLTVASVNVPEFCVALIPTTLARTTLGRKGVGRRVNIETDIVARTVVHAVESMVKPSGVTPQWLRDRGFD